MMAELSKSSHIGVLSSQFPSSARRDAGLFVRERMFRVASHLPLFVVSPTPWIPFEDWIRQNLIPDFRPSVPEYEEQRGIPVWYPRFPSLPGALQRLDGWAMAWGAYSRFAALRTAGRLDLIDAHGAWPDGYAGVLLGRRFGVPVTITLHGGELLYTRNPRLIPKLREAFRGAARIFAVCDSLRQFAIELGVGDEKVEVVGNGVDAGYFRPLDRDAMRAALGLPLDAKVLVSVSQPSEEKVHHRVIDVLPSLAGRWPGLVYLIAGSGGMEGSVRAELEAQAGRLGVSEAVRFPGETSPDGLPGLLSAADVFVHAARREGTANVLLEAMACGLPVVTIDAGSHRETICRPELGELVPFGEQQALEGAIDRVLSKSWNRATIRRHAEAHNWDGRIGRLCRVFSELAGEQRR